MHLKCYRLAVECNNTLTHPHTSTLVGKIAIKSKLFMRPINGQVVSSSIHLGAYFRAEHLPHHRPLRIFPKVFRARCHYSHIVRFFYAISAQTSAAVRGTFPALFTLFRKHFQRLANKESVI